MKKLKEQKEKFREIVKKTRAKFRCAACDGAKCGHTLGCQALDDILEALKD